MADGQHGGHRTPSKPAAVSGPGKLSKRTDGRPNQMDITGEPYGQNDFREIQSGAKMGDPAPSAPSMSGGGQAPSLIPLDAPTQRPGEPVTAGAALGAGPGPEALGINPNGLDQQDVDRLRAYLPALIAMANRPDSTSSFRSYVRTLRAQVR